MSLKIKHKMLLLASLPCLVVALTLLVLVNKQLNEIMEVDLKLLRETLVDARKTELQHSLDIALSLTKPLYDSSSESAMQDAINLLKEFKYGKDGYFFGYDGNSVRIFSGTDTNNLGKSYADYKDVNGVFLINELVKQGKAGGGFVTYHFPRLGDTSNIAYPKLSYAVWLEKWNLMIGTGFYIDDIDTTIAKARATSEAHTHEILIMVFVVTLCILVLVIFIALFVAQRIAQPINLLAKNLRDIASGGGDLTQRLHYDHADELGELTKAFNEFVNTIHKMVSAIYQLTASLTGISQNVVTNTNQTFEILDNQKNQTLQIASAINEMAASAMEVARSTQESAAAVSAAEEVTRNAELLASKSIREIKELSHEVQLDSDGVQQLQTDVLGIGSVLDVIRGVAEQTNLIALNASIEAARAGEQGRGFAVVADEVRGLAARTQESTRVIQDMIQRLQSSTSITAESIRRSLIKGETSEQYVSETAQALNVIDDQVGTINQRSIQIAAAAEEQTQVIESINQNMHQIADATEAANKSAEQSQQMGIELDKLGKQLEALIKQFKV